MPFPPTSPAAGPSSLPRRLPQATAWPLHAIAATRRIESQAQARQPVPTLMQRAGASLARVALALAPHAPRVWVACGPGNNGGDGLEAAAHLAALGRQVSVTLEASPQRLPADSRAAWQRAAAAGVRPLPQPPALDADDLVVDALLGIGADRAPEGSLAERIGQVNRHRGLVLAVDVPSGLQADTGRVLGREAVVARHTLTFLTAKPGLFTGRGRDHAGTVWLDDLDVPAGELGPDAWLSPLVAAPSPPRPHGSHKGSFGDVLVVGGATGMQGAAVLAAMAAHAGGAGRVYLGLLGAPADPPMTMRPELMVRPAPWLDEPGRWSHAVVACGCGGGEEIGPIVAHWLRHAASLVLDADALNAIAADAALQRQCRARAGRGQVTVITPHPLEAARLLDASTAQVQDDRIAAATSLAQRYGCIAVLKGSGTVVASPGERSWINATGSAALASPGTGDVLTGWLAGRWAAAGATAPPAREIALQVSRDAVLVHGQGAVDAGFGPMRATDLIEAMHRISSGR